LNFLIVTKQRSKLPPPIVALEKTLPQNWQRRKAINMVYDALVKVDPRSVAADLPRIAKLAFSVEFGMLPALFNNSGPH